MERAFMVMNFELVMGANPCELFLFFLFFEDEVPEHGVKLRFLECVQQFF